LSGGSGTRLWPMSRALYPKQLLSLLGRESLLQQTVRRVADPHRFAAPLIVANDGQLSRRGRYRPPRRYLQQKL